MCAPCSPVGISGRLGSRVVGLQCDIAQDSMFVSLELYQEPQTLTFFCCSNRTGLQIIFVLIPGLTVSLYQLKTQLKVWTSSESYFMSDNDQDNQTRATENSLNIVSAVMEV